MANEGVAIEQGKPHAAISPWDLGEVETALKKIRGISMMGSTADSFDTEGAQWTFYNLSEIADDALKLIRAAEKEG